MNTVYTVVADSAANTNAVLPCGAPVQARGNMLHPDHRPEAVQERAAWQFERFAVGTVVRRDDGCLVMIRTLAEPTCGGYVYAHGARIDRMTGDFDGCENCATGPLVKCATVKLEREPQRPRCMSWQNAWSGARPWSVRQGRSSD